MDEGKGRFGRSIVNDVVVRGVVVGAMSLLMALSSAVHAQRGDFDRVEATTRSADSDVAGSSSPFRPRGPGVSRPLAISLPAIVLQRALAKTNAAPRPGVPHKIGFGRDIAALADPARTAASLQWERTPDGGKIAAISVTLAQAKGTRLGILVKRLPDSAILRIYRQESETVFEISGREVLENLRRNTDAGDSGDKARTFWAPYVEGEQVTLEVWLPPEVDPEALEITLPRIAQFFASPYAAYAQQDTNIGASASCQLDASCYAEWNDVGNATAKLSFVGTWGDGYVCSGTLLNNKAGGQIPYLLTAKHCISAQSEASSLQSFWFYRSSACNSGVLNPASQTLTGGASLLYTSSTTDTSLLRLNRTPPAGAVYAGWLGETTPALNTRVASVHHPEGDLQKVSMGSLSGYWDCWSVLGRMNCYERSQVDGSHYQVALSAGIMEPGSSGSGLYATIGGAHYLIGQLQGADATCNTPGGAAFYGRFDAAYKAGLKRWLDGTGCFEKAVHRYRNTSILGHFYTTSTAEGASMIASGVPIEYEGVAFTACDGGSTLDGLFPVYRFKHLVRNGVYFYSMLPEEISFVRANLGHLLKDEGVAFHAYNGAASGRYPMYRFRNTSVTGANFYTILEAERANVVANVPGYEQEGIGFYALPPR